jgi:TetR/AcrR family transcriptional repressor of nem operon
MRYDTEHKQRTHEKLVQEAAKAIRLHGPDKIGVAALMSTVGLTHGGFYAHFGSKDELIAAAIGQMFADRGAVLRDCMTAADPARELTCYVDRYVSTLHRDRPDQGCPVACLAGDIGRLPAVARARFEAGTQSMIDALAAVLAALDRPRPELLAASAVAEMVGAIATARAIANAALSEQMLDAARASVKARLGLDVVGH